MRNLLTLSLLAAAAVPVAAQADCGTLSSAAVPSSTPSVIVPGFEPEAEAIVAPTPLSDIAADSPWRQRFETAAEQLLPALRSGDASRWAPLLGGQWLAANDKQAVERLLQDRCGVFANLASGGAPVERRIFGWAQLAGWTAEDSAELAARPQGEALVCWSARRDGVAAAWPRFAAEADNRADRPYACARITYSLRGDTPAWRAFVDHAES